MGLYIGTTPVDKVFVSMTLPSATATVQAEKKTVTNADYSSTSISFTGLSKEPSAFVVRLTDSLTAVSSLAYVFITEIQYDGSNVVGSTFLTQGGYLPDTTHYSFTYENGTLTVKSSGTLQSYGGAFYSGTYELTAFYT